MDQLISTALQHIRRFSKWQIGIWAIGWLIAIWVIDYSLKIDLGLSIFYVLPIAAITWTLNASYGYSLSVIALTLWLIADHQNTCEAGDLMIDLWNAATRLTFLGLVVALLTKLKQAYVLEQQLAQTDGLTALLNRRAFIERLEQEILRSQRFCQPFTLAYIDIDNFKQVNDRFGHAAGDSLLQAVASTLTQSLRSIDYQARLGGDEFAILMPQTSEPQAVPVLNRLRIALQTPQSQQVPVSFSIGVVTFESAPGTADQALAVADRLMYSVKTGGKGQLVHKIFDTAH